MTYSNGQALDAANQALVVSAATDLELLAGDTPLCRIPISMNVLALRQRFAAVAQEWARYRERKLAGMSTPGDGSRRIMEGKAWLG